MSMCVERKWSVERKESENKEIIKNKINFQGQKNFSALLTTLESNLLVMEVSDLSVCDSTKLFTSHLMGIWQKNAKDKQKWIILS